MIRCMVLVAALCSDAHHVKTQMDNFGLGYVATIIAESYEVHSGATDVIDMHDFRKAPKACVDGTCIRYHKFCAPAAGAKVQCSYRVVWPGIVPDGAVSIVANDRDALTLAEQETSLIVERDGKSARIPFASMTVLAPANMPDACPQNLTFSDCDPP